MIKCSVTGIPTAIKDLIIYKRSLPEKARQMIEKLGQAGYEVASAKFSTAIYAGLNDVMVTLNWENDTLALIAQGEAVAFIEFGTGTHYAEQYPKPYEENGLVGRGEFGYKLGRFDSWRYKGDPGNEGEVIQQGPYKGWIKTHGNPPARAMYDASEESRNKIEEIVKEVLK